MNGANRYPWLVVALLMPVALLNYLDRQMLASMKFSVMADIPDIGLEANWGTMLAQFKWVYAFLSPIGGYLADRFSRRSRIAGSLFVWSAVTWATGHVTTYEELLWTRALMGISEAFYIPAALALIADYHPGGTRSRAVGLHQMGIYVGVIVGGFGGYVADHPGLGWRLAFDALRPRRHALRGAAVPAPANAPRAWSRRRAARHHPVGALRELLGNGSFILLVLYFTLPALAGWVVRDWMPAILKAEFNIGQGRPACRPRSTGRSPPSSARWSAAGWRIAGCGSTARGRIYVSAIGMSLIVPAMFGVGYAPQTGLLWVAVAFLILFGLGWGFFDCNNMPILCQIVRPAAARHRLRHHELRQHQLRRVRRLGLRRAARPAGAAQRHLRRLRERGDSLDRARAPDSPALLGIRAGADRTLRRILGAVDNAGAEV